MRRPWLKVAVLVLAVAAVILAAVVAGATGGGGRPAAVVVQPTNPPPTLSTLPPPTQTTLQPDAIPGNGPGAFTTRTVPGPIQVQVLAEPECVGYVGEGWRVRYRITNDGPRRSAPVGAAVDNAVPQVINPNLILRRGGRVEDVAVVYGGGDGLVVSWMGVVSFPVEVEACPTNPADEQAAEQVTTTT
jgi:hypothetical protein